jgi:hypothetical protein
MLEDVLLFVLNILTEKI